MQLYGDYHTHTTFSHGKGSIEDNVKAAIGAGLKQIAITDHGLKHIAFGLRLKKIREMRRQISELNDKYGNIDILLGVEANIRGFDGQIDIGDEEFALFDMILVGYHKLVWPQTVKDAALFFAYNYFLDISKVRASARTVDRNTQAVINNIQRFPVDVLTHINHGLSVNCKAIAETCAKCGTYIEINGKRITYSDRQMQDMLSTSVKLIINSDAHSPERVGEVSRGEALVKRLGIPHERIVNLNGGPIYLRSQSAYASKRVSL